MPTISFYTQARRDGGVRTGIVIDGETAFTQFEEGDGTNPLLAWFIDVDCRGDGLPTDPESARAWLIDRGPIIRRGLEDLASQVEPGVDLDVRPVRATIPDASPGTEITVTCTANRRIDARRLAEHIRDVARHWCDRIRSLPTLHTSER